MAWRRHSHHYIYWWNSTDDCGQVLYAVRTFTKSATNDWLVCHQQRMCVV